ncbi:MAG: hypothetical protein LBL67_04830 [Coriobacteriales bacterium]|jgi:hypothetical protein|nr:hypothetical protein [Coriobacteriales bacterium]
MCFRPAGVSLPDPVCPECGKTLHMVGGTVLKKCPFCKADLTEYAKQYMAENGLGGAAAPGAPAAPAAPGAPAAPAAPKPPAPPAA